MTEGKKGTPGSGRYTHYIPTDVARQARWKSLKSIFNDRAAGDQGLFYNGDSNESVTKSVVETAINSFSNVNYDMSMFPDGVTKDYAGAPNLDDVKWSKAGGPANPYAPDVSSPGPGNTDGTTKDKDPGLDVDSFNRPEAGNTPNTTSPSATSGGAVLGSILVGQVLQGGKAGAVK